MYVVKIKKILRIIGIFLIVLSFILPLSINKHENEVIVARRKEVNNYINKINYSDNRFHYVAILEIPQIDLKLGLVDKNSNDNNVNKNIQILDGSEFPNKINTNLILASHSGTSKVSFFNDLNKLSIGDTIYIYYNDYKYIYKLDNIYEIKKTGAVDIIRNKDKNTITLITCKNNDDNTQVSYIGYLIDKVDY